MLILHRPVVRFCVILTSLKQNQNVKVNFSSFIYVRTCGKARVNYGTESGLLPVERRHIISILGWPCVQLGTFFRAVAVKDCVAELSFS